ncbi:MAG TPA: response regulator [Phenylobacterium sp.]|nr:response regulator [Phenylobacterium sp.]
MSPPACAEPHPTVLVVDDDAAVRTALEFTLELEGFDVVTCESGEALLLRDLPARNACLVIGERLPGISGMETLQRLRARQVTLPAILVSSHPKAAFRAAAEAAGAPILEKPLIGDALMTSIHDALVG